VNVAGDNHGFALGKWLKAIPGVLKQGLAIAGQIMQELWGTGSR
jgi:hypothetical protein